MKEPVDESPSSWAISIPPRFEDWSEAANGHHMRKSRFTVWKAFLGMGLVFCTTQTVRAQADSLESPGRQDAFDRPVVQAVRAAYPPVIDGDVLEDPIWAAVVPVSDFTQNTPNEGRPASEHTEVRILYTDEAIYFGIVCYDRDPNLIIVADSRRDSPLNETDSFQIILDTYLDEQNGFVFGTNPSGLEYDGQVVNEGQGSGFLAAARGGGTTGASFNLNWDGAWTVRTRLSDIGWSAEFAIPFRSLRYPGNAIQTWGVNFQRNIRRRNESAFWAPLPRGLNLYRLSLAGRLTGLEVPPQRNLKLTPYVLGERRFSGGAPQTSWLGDTGLDVKYSISPSLTFDATYNTDFAHVEADEQQINLNRFNLFFPEKRPFFLENAGLFAVGNPGSTEVFFSRRVGIGPEGVAIPILLGTRLSGNIRGTSVGFLNMQTEEVPTVAPANNFTVARVRRDLPNRSSLGILFVNRQDTTGGGPSEADYNRSYAVDGRIGTGVNGRLVGFAARTDTPGVEGSEHAFDIGWVYEAPSLLLNLQYTEVGENFNPEVGFLTRRGFRQANVLYFRTVRLSSDRRLHEIRPHLRVNSFWDFNGFHESALIHIDSHWEFRNASEIHTGMNLTREGVVVPFEIAPGIIVPPGTYDHAEAQIVAMTNQGAPGSFRMTAYAGGFFGGTRVSLAPSVKWRTGETFNTELNLRHINVGLPVGNFVTNLIRGRVSYSFSPRLSLQSLAQYNSRGDEWSLNLRFSWLHQANTGVFVVYNDTRSFGEFELPGAGRRLLVKVSHLFDLLK